MNHPLVAQAAVVGRPHPIKGQSICSYVTLIEGAEGSEDLLIQMKQQVRSGVGPFAQPDAIIITGKGINPSFIISQCHEVLTQRLY